MLSIPARIIATGSLVRKTGNGVLGGLAGVNAQFRTVMVDETWNRGGRDIDAGNAVNEY
jgi:hypothetical protein